MIALAEILGLILLNAFCLAAFRQWRAARRGGIGERAARQRAAPYPFHPSPDAGFRLDAAPEGGAHVRPAGIDW
jgi:hypothetical protein